MFPCARAAVAASVETFDGNLADLVIASLIHDGDIMIHHLLNVVD